MGKLKHEFHEVIAGEYGAIEDLETTYRAAYDAYFSMLAAMPSVWRSPEQQQSLDGAYAALSWSKWKLDQARDWARYARRA